MGKFATKIEEITGLEEKKFIKLFKERDKEFVSAMQHVHTAGLRSLKMLNGEESWDPSLKSKRDEEGRPCLSENLLPDFVNKPHGEFCMSAPSANVTPVDSEGDPKVAKVIKGLIYNTSYQSQGASIHNDAFYMLLGSGLAAWRVLTRRVNDKSFNQEHFIKAIQNPFSVSWDLAADAPDLSDKKWVLVKDSLVEAEFKKLYGEDAWKPADWEKSAGDVKDLWFTNKKATVAEAWWLQEDPYTLYEHPDGSASREKPSTDVNEDGEPLKTATAYDKCVYSCTMSSSDVLTEPVEWPDYTENPIIPVVVVHGRKIVIAGKIHYKSLIADGLDLQQLHNYWITAITESIALQPDAPYLATEAQISGYEEWTDLSKKVRAMRYKNDPKAGSPLPVRQQPPQLSGAVLSMPQYTRQALRDIIGLQQASLGQSGNEKSGIAIQKRKQEGDAGKFSFVENITRGIELEARIQVNTLPSIMDTPRIERIVGPDGSKELAYIKKKNPDAPKGDKPIDLSVGKYDVAVTTGPTFNTQRDEAKQILVQLFQYLGPIAPAAVTAMAPKLLKLIDVPDAEELGRIIVATLPPQLQAFYPSDENEDLMKKIPPAILNQVRELAQNFQQLQALAQQQAQAIEALKKEEALKMAEIQGKQKIDLERIKVERERNMKDITLKEKDIEARVTIEREKIEAQVELKLAELMETFKAQKELIKYKAEMEKKEVTSAEPVQKPGTTEVAGKGIIESEPAQAEPAPIEASAQEPIQTGSEGPIESEPEATGLMQEGSEDTANQE